MPLKLYDTMSGKKRLFRPVQGNLVRIYTCGPSVYALSHIGNFRTYIFEDILVRYLRYKGYRVKRVMNITDIEDKAIIGARKEGKTLSELEGEKIRAFERDFNLLGLLRPDVTARASKHVKQMIEFIQRICFRGFCLDESDGVYFNVRKFRQYGCLSHLKNKRYLGKARGDDYSKEGLWDFRLWKKWTHGDGKVRWKSPFGDGRPGWHIECSAMSSFYLGRTFDIHCGGTDNIYPHHENEIAQSMAAYGVNPARFWMHAKHLTLRKRKMSKRTGNVLYIRDLIRWGAHPKCLRFYLSSEKYCNRLDFDQETFEKKVCGCEFSSRELMWLGKLAKKSVPNTMDNSGISGKRIARDMIRDFERAMDDDLDTRRAYKYIFRAFEEVRSLRRNGRISKKDAIAILDAAKRIDSVLGVFF